MQTSSQEDTRCTHARARINSQAELTHTQVLGHSHFFLNTQKLYIIYKYEIHIRPSYAQNSHTNPGTEKTVHSKIHITLLTEKEKEIEIYILIIERTQYKSSTDRQGAPIFFSNCGHFRQIKLGASTQATTEIIEYVKQCFVT